MADRNSGFRAPQLVVGIGASAGGLEAFKELLPQLPADADISYVLVQHLDRHHRSFLIELLEPYTSMKVKLPEAGAPLLPNEISVIQPNTELTVADGEFRVNPHRDEPGPRMTVDYLFESLAHHYGPRSTGIVLSGAGTDGTRGLRAIKAVGGLTIAQTPASAAQPGMPRNAIERGAAELVLELDEMAAALHRYVTYTKTLDPDGNDADVDPGPDGQVYLDPREFAQLAAILDTQSHFDIRSYKKPTIERRLYRRMLLGGASDVYQYFEHLRAHEDECRALVQDLLIGVTEFFRDPEAFDVTGELLTDLIADATKDEPLRCWVAGCATGEEAFSLAILIQEKLEAVGRIAPVQIFATDVNPVALQTARVGIYPRAALSDVSKERLARFFVPVEGGRFQVLPFIRDKISFAHHDLTCDPPFSSLDLISCRNVLIYLEREIQEQVFRTFHFALKRDGHLLLGTSETPIEADDLFAPASRKWRLYRRKASSKALPVLPARVREWRSKRTRLAWAEPRSAPRTAVDEGLLQRSLIQSLLPPTVVVTEDNSIRYMQGDLRPYLAFPAGDVFRMDLLALLSDDLTTRTQSVMMRARRTRDRVEAIAHFGEEGSHVRIRATPAAGLEDGTLAVTFESFENDPSAAQEPHTSPGDSEAVAAEVVHELERELSRTRGELRSAIDELESANEELRASHEESMAVNEELLSANEDLEASGEELRSLNEELTTVNNQLRDKLVLLEEANDDLSNFFGSARVPMLFLDQELRVKRMTPAAEEQLRLGSSETGSFVGDIARELLQSGLAEQAREVLRSLESSSVELRLSDGRWYSRRVNPYQTERQTISGVVVVLVDITEHKESEAALTQAYQRLEVAMSAAGMGLHEYHPQTDEIFWDQRVRDLWGLDPDEPVTYEAFMEGLHPDDRERTQRAVDKSFDPNGTREYYAEYRVTNRKTKETQWVAATGHVFFEGDRAVRLVGTAQNIERRRRQRFSDALLSAVTQEARDAIVMTDLEGVVIGWNPAARDLFGYAATEIIGHPIERLVPDEERAEKRARLERAKEGEELTDVPVVRTDAAGNELSLLLSLRSATDDQGQPVGLSAMYRRREQADSRGD